MPGPRITAIVPHVLRARLPADLATPVASFVGDGAVLLEVTTSVGLVGWGEPSPYGAPLPELIDAIGAVAAPLVGLPVGELGGALRRVTTERSHAYGALARGAAVAGLTQAAWDLRGKLEDRPVYELLAREMGTQVPDGELSVEAYASAGMFYEDQPDDAMVEEALRLQALGYRAYKVRPPTAHGAGSHFARSASPPPFDADALARRLARVRSAVGQNLDLMVDLGRRLPDVESAVRFADSVAPHGIRFIEEPIAGSLEDHRELRDRTAIPLAGGEQSSDADELARWIDAGALDIVQPDAGLMAIDRIVEFVRRDPDRARRHLIPHSWANPVCIAANAHVAVASGATVIEANETFNPMRAGLLAVPLTPQRGRIPLSGLPGLGVEVDREALAHFTG
jgi:D-galactarolactone cycloisomerase